MQYWECVDYSILPYDYPRGYFVLFFEDYELENAWQKIQELTANGNLGWKSSIAPGPMPYGYAKGMTAICIHVPHWREEDVENVLINNGFQDAIRDYRRKN